MGTVPAQSPRSGHAGAGAAAGRRGVRSGRAPEEADARAAAAARGGAGRLALR